MIHLVYLDNKEKVLEKIMSGKKNNDNSRSSRTQDSS